MEKVNEKDFECKCGCGLNNLKNDIKDRLNNARKHSGIPFALLESSRCAEYNKTLGKHEESPYVKGLAVRIKITHQQDCFKIVTALKILGFNRIGISNTAIYVDTDKSKSPSCMWAMSDE